jgi:hypothetical protein
MDVHQPCPKRRDGVLAEVEVKSSADRLGIVLRASGDNCLPGVVAGQTSG